MTRIFIDGVFDLFHVGHENLLRRAKQNYQPCEVIVGIHSDKVVSSYKRAPTWNERKRYEAVRNFEYVDGVVEDFPLGITKEFIENYNIDYVLKGKEEGSTTVDWCYAYPREQGILVEIPRTEGISSTQLAQELI